MELGHLSHSSERRKRLRIPPQRLGGYCGGRTAPEAGMTPDAARSEPVPAATAFVSCSVIPLRPDDPCRRRPVASAGWCDSGFAGTDSTRFVRSGKFFFRTVRGSRRGSDPRGRRRPKRGTRATGRRTRRCPSVAWPPGLLVRNGPQLRCGRIAPSATPRRSARTAGSVGAAADVRGGSASVRFSVARGLGTRLRSCPYAITRGAGPCPRPPARSSARFLKGGATCEAT